jgi:hypothetical protein
MDILKKLTSRINDICPIHGLQATDEDPRNWTIDYRDEATDEEKAAASAFLASLDVPAVQGEVEADEAEEQRLQKIDSIQTRVLDALLEWFDAAEQAGKPITPKLAAVLEKWRENQEGS